MRPRSELRAFTKKKIAKRLSIIRRIWRDTIELYENEQGRLSKYNLNCSCGMCRMPKYRDTRKKQKQKEQESGKV